MTDSRSRPPPGGSLFTVEMIDWTEPSDKNGPWTYVMPAGEGFNRTTEFKSPCDIEAAYVYVVTGGVCGKTAHRFSWQDSGPDYVDPPSVSLIMMSRLGFGTSLGQVKYVR